LKARFFRTLQTEKEKSEMATATETMSKEAFQASKEYLALTEKQRVWVDAFVDSQDAGQATVLAYGDNPDSAYRAMLTRKVETSPRVIAALDLFYGRSPKEKFIRDLQLDIARAKGVARVEGRRLYARVTGLIDSAPDAAVEHRFNVGDICIQDGRKYRVTSIDAHGHPLTADEVTL
jgi:hypothetical protein